MAGRDDGAGEGRTQGAGSDASQQGLDALYGRVYPDLRRLAAVLMRHDRDATISPTGVVDLAYLKLQRSGLPPGASEQAVKGIAFEAMKQVLGSMARARRADKRGGDWAVHVTQSAAADVSAAADTTGDEKADELRALAAALERLQRDDPRQARLVALRYFEGLTVEAAAAALGVSTSVAERDWRAARARLAAEVRGHPARR